MTRGLLLGSFAFLRYVLPVKISESFAALPLPINVERMPGLGLRPTLTGPKYIPRSAIAKPRARTPAQAASGLLGVKEMRCRVMIEICGNLPKQKRVIDGLNCVRLRLTCQLLFHEANGSSQLALPFCNDVSAHLIAHRDDGAFYRLGFCRGVEHFHQLP